jgi:hypothetical protein
MAKEKAETPTPFAIVMVTGMLIVSPAQDETELDWYCPMVVVILFVLWALIGFKVNKRVPRINIPRRRFRQVEKSRKEFFFMGTAC